MSGLSAFSTVVFGELQGLFVAILLCLLIGTINHNKKEGNYISHKLYVVYIAYMISAVMDFFSRFFAEVPKSARPWFAVMYSLMYAANKLGPLFWLYFSEEHSKTHFGKSFSRKVLASIPAAVYMVLALSSPWTGAVFVLSEDVKYSRGPFFALGTYIDLFYFVFTSVRALMRARAAENKEEKLINYSFAAYCVPIVVTSLIQFFTRYSFKGLGSVVSLTVVYILIVSYDSQNTREIVNGLAEDFFGVFLVDVDRDLIRIVRITGAYKRKFDKLESEPSYKARVLERVVKNVVPADKEKVKREFDAEYVYSRLEERSSYFVTYRVISKDGREYYNRAKFVKMEMGTSRHFIIGIRDADSEIREEMREEAEERAREDLIKILSEGYTALYLYNFKEGKSILQSFNEKSDPLIVNEAKTKNYEEMLEWYITNLVHPDDRKLMRETTNPENAKKLLADKKRHSIVFRRDFDGEYRYEELTLAKVETESREPVNIALGFVEIDEGYREKIEQAKILSEALKKADAASDAKSTFLFSMSHDIRTPMNAIMGFTDLATKHIDEKERVAEYLSKIDVSSRYLLNLINDVLDMARVEAGKIQSDIKPMNIQTETDNIVTICRETALEHGVEFNYIKKDIKTTTIYADALHLYQIMMNILSNAIKYTPKGGSVNFTVRELKNPEKGNAKFSFTVADTGIGMSKEFLEHIFDSFAREQSSTISGIQGTGLGMSIVKRLVDYMGGTIDIDSAPGEGTSVTVVLSFKHTKGKEKKDSTGRTKGVSFEGRRVLCVEDNELNREIITAILKEEKIITEEAANGEQAVEMIEKNGTGYYDCILMDIQMPVMDGYAATHKIRKLEGGEAIPIIALSANAFEDDKNKSLEEGMNAHIAKPINVRELHDTMRKLMTKKK